MNLDRAEAYRDQLHDLPDGYSPREELDIHCMAIELAEARFDKMDKASLRDEWLDAHVDDFRLAAIDQLGLCK